MHLLILDPDPAVIPSLHSLKVKPVRRFSTLEDLSNIPCTWRGGICYHPSDSELPARAVWRIQEPFNTTNETHLAHAAEFFRSFVRTIKEYCPLARVTIYDMPPRSPLGESNEVVKIKTLAAMMVTEILDWLSPDSSRIFAPSHYQACILQVRNALKMRWGDQKVYPIIRPDPPNDLLAHIQSLRSLQCPHRKTGRRPDGITIDAVGQSPQQQLECLKAIRERFPYRPAEPSNS